MKLGNFYILSIPSSYIGDFKNGEYHGFGTIYYGIGDQYAGNFCSGFPCGKGVFTYKNGISKKTCGGGIQLKQSNQCNGNKEIQPSLLRTTFKKLSQSQRKLIQSNLKDLGLYKSSIDGLYGKGTAGALTAYNKQYLGGADLKKSANAEKLIDAVLALNKTEVAAPETPIGGDTTLAEVEPEVEVTLAEPQVEIPQTYQAGIEAYNSGDFKTALEQAKLLAPLGDVDAQFYLGKMCAEGKGTLQRNIHAHMWFNLASANGHSEAALERDALTEKMTPAAVEKAQDLAAICMDSQYQDCSLGAKPQPINQNTIKTPAKTKYADGDKSAIKASFKEQSLLRRKQIQYALSKRGYYSSSIDGLWGKGTERAVVNYGQDNKLSPNSPAEMFSTVVSKVDVPSSFAVVKPKKALVPKRVQPSQNGSGQAANSRKLPYRKKCEDYGYTLGTPDFNQCLASERRDYEQKQDFQEMKDRDDEEIKRVRRRQHDCFFIDFLRC